MKKLLFALGFLFSVSMFSCGNAETNTENTDSVEVVDSAVVNTICIDTIA